LFHYQLLIFRLDNQNNNLHYSLKPLLKEPQNRSDKSIQELSKNQYCSIARKLQNKLK
jgi:hypothetical protein